MRNWPAWPVPVFDAKGASCAALCLSFPYTRFGEDYFSSNIPLLKETAAEISQRLGCSKNLIPPEVLDLTLY